MSLVSQRLLQCFCLVLFSLYANLGHARLPWVGQFLYAYEGGNLYRVTAAKDGSMHWQCVQGSEAGATGDEQPQRMTVNPDIYFVTWTEKSGTQVTQVLDFKNMKVYSTVVDGRDKFVLRGSMRREK